MATPPKTDPPAAAAKPGAKPEPAAEAPAAAASAAPVKAGGIKAWLPVIAALVLAQKLVPGKAVLDVPLALAIIGLGVLIIVAPSSVPGLMPSM